jgi:hypothetical protein
MTPQERTEAIGVIVEFMALTDLTAEQRQLCIEKIISMIKRF